MSTITLQRPLRTEVSNIVMQAVIDLHNAGRIATRQMLAQITCLSLGVVDDHIKRAIDDGRLRRVSPGVVEPVEVLPQSRPVSFTRLPNGMAKLEIGDVCLDLTPGEERTIGRYTAGAAAELSALQMVRELQDEVATLTKALTAERRKSDRKEAKAR